MRAAATSDIHYDLLEYYEDHDELKRLIESLMAEKPDILVIAGDTVGLGEAKLEECLALFEAVTPERMMVFGNHEYWSADLNTFKELKMLETRIENCGFHLLDSDPKTIGSVGFVGNCAWYDYSFASKAPPLGSSYEKKLFNEQIVWNDALFVKLGKNDREYSDELIERLESDIARIENSVDTIVAVTHHAGFKEAVIQKENNPEWNFTNAFMGSTRLGEMLRRHPKVKYHIYGHTHRKAQVEKEHLVSINPGSTYQKKKYIVFEVS